MLGGINSEGIDREVRQSGFDPVISQFLDIVPFSIGIGQSNVDLIQPAILGDIVIVVIGYIGEGVRKPDDMREREALTSMGGSISCR